MTGYAKIIADSVALDGTRVTTMEVRFHRFVLAEFNTHRVFSRNSASSRAIPFAKQLRILEDHGPAFPLEWPQEQKGMQGGELFSDEAIEEFRRVWLTAAKATAGLAQTLASVGLHKSIVNRLIEPYMWHTVVVTSTAWENFFLQRVSPLAQPEIRAAASMMLKAYQKSKPQILGEEDWHLPYMDFATADDAQYDPTILTKVSAARCARTSYLTQDGKRDIDVDLELFGRLLNADPAPHWSPFEHVCTPWPDNHQTEWISFTEVNEAYEPVDHAVHTDHLPRVGNLLNFRSLRTTLETIKDVTTYA